MAWLWIPQFGLEVPPKFPNRNSANIQMDYHILSELKSLEGARCEIKMISVWRILIVVIHVFQHGCFCWAKLINLVFQLVAKSPNTRHKRIWSDSSFDNEIHQIYQSNHVWEDVSSPQVSSCKDSASFWAEGQRAWPQRRLPRTKVKIHMGIGIGLEKLLGCI
jgi:hypothetical protein